MLVHFAAKGCVTLLSKRGTTVLSSSPPLIQEVYTGGEGRNKDKIKHFTQSSECAETARANQRVERRLSRRQIRCQAEFPTSELLSLAITGPNSLTKWYEARLAAWDYRLPVNQILVASAH